ncbi:hypothetical protein BHE90_012502 [Fusarium euwallaceae]|uniref:Uncharacterized protein n=2 Tax=Fusarium solani species complex TaxID=232080 RepID=A0A3M2RSU3_9HYPO|nr:hypothetical protein CDV36_012460 [Fusarium kuroshium]RTE73073.1 hypothetical protein BHE90_012502 [Fusarium euwallaceae]
MSNSNSCLKTEVSRLAKLSNIQGGLPPLMRGLPVLAILAGEAVAKATDSRNLIEERMFGTDEVVSLQGPTQTISTTNKEWARPGVREMCQRCEGGTKQMPKDSHALWMPRIGTGFGVMTKKDDGWE